MCSLCVISCTLIPRHVLAAKNLSNPSRLPTAQDFVPSSGTCGPSLAILGPPWIHGSGSEVSRLLWHHIRVCGSRNHEEDKEGPRRSLGLRDGDRHAERMGQTMGFETQPGSRMVSYPMSLQGFRCGLRPCDITFELIEILGRCFLRAGQKRRACFPEPTRVRFRRPTGSHTATTYVGPVLQSVALFRDHLANGGRKTAR